jgi:hypothetical protein
MKNTRQTSKLWLPLSRTEAQKLLHVLNSASTTDLTLAAVYDRLAIAFRNKYHTKETE